MRIHRSLVLTSILILLLSLGACVGTTRHTADGPHLLTILHTNDHHGRFWKNGNNEYGLAARRTLADRVRTEVHAAGGDVLLLDAGDINTGVPESDMLDAEPDILGMNLMGYNAMTAGNHEFDNPPEVLHKQEQWMHFPLLAANIYDADGKRLFTPYRFYALHGLRVAVFGLTTETTAFVGNPDYIKGMTFRPAVEEARELVPQLRQRADVVIALTHLGYMTGPEALRTGLGSIALARAVPGIDLIVDGHSHTELSTPVRENGTIIVQAGEYGKYLGRVDLVCDAGRVSLSGGQLLPVNLTKKIVRDGTPIRVPAGEIIPEDPAMLQTLTPYEQRGTEALQRVVGRTLAEFTDNRESMRSRATTLGTLACRALIAKTGADLVVMNSGGIRSGLPAGNITYKDVLTVKPFGNTICTVPMTGADLQAYLLAAATMEPGTGGFAQFDGVSFELEKGALRNLLVNGKPVESGRIYTVAMESYQAAGGDGYPKIADRPGFVDTGFVDADVLQEYIAAHSPLRPEDYPPAAVRR